MVASAPEMLPITAVSNVIGRPSRTSMLPRAIELRVVPLNSCRKSAVRVLVPFRRTLVGLAVWVSTIHGESVTVAPDPFTIATVSQSAALGPVLQPHQLSAAFTVDADPPVPDSMDMPVVFPGAVLPTMRLNWTFSVPPDNTKIPPPPSVLPLAWFEVIVTLLMLRLVVPGTAIVPVMPQNV